MAYVGNQPARGQWRKLTDISASFNGVLTTFTTSVPPGTSEYYVTAGSASQLIVSLGGVIQQPDTDYTVSTNSITFTTAPASGLSFFAVLGGDALNTGTPSDGTVTASKLSPAGGLEGQTFVINGSGQFVFGSPGAAGAGGDRIFFLNEQNVTTNYSVPAGFNAGTFGPCTIDSGVTVTIPSGSSWVIV